MTRRDRAKKPDRPVPRQKKLDRNQQALLYAALALGYRALARRFELLGDKVYLNLCAEDARAQAAGLGLILEFKVDGQESA